MARRASSLPKEVFLSHASRDRSFATRLAEDIRRHGVPVWFSRTNLMGAQQWHDEIGRALARCDWFAVILSPASVSSRWVKHELIYVLNNPRYEAHIVPVLYRKCDPAKLSWTLRAFQMVNFVGRGRYEAACRELLRVWGLAYHDNP
ncbi:MAG: toll/interleukin-1 receptor domain-containing protein [Planctomycetota bacterium]